MNAASLMTLRDLIDFHSENGFHLKLALTSCRDLKNAFFFHYASLSIMAPLQETPPKKKKN